MWAVLVPEALAYATIAGVSPEVGLYAAPAALILYALFGSSHHLVTGPLAAVVIAALIELVDIKALIELYRASTSRLNRIYGRVGARPDFIAALAAMLGVLVFDTLPGLVIGIAASLILLVYRSSRPHIAELGAVPGSDGEFGDVDRHPDRTEIPGVKVVRVESGLFFANADAVRSRFLELAGEEAVRAIVLDAESMPYIDVTAALMLRGLADDLNRRGVTLAMAKEIGQVRDILRAEGDDEIPLFTTVAEAVAACRTEP